jgi:hypothetical protein
MTRAHQTRAGACLALVVALGSGGPAAAQSPAPVATASGVVAGGNGPDATVRAAFTELTGILYAPPSDARDQEIAALLVRYVDFEELTRRFFGEPCPQPGCVDHWAEFTAAQRTEVLGLLQSELTEVWTRQLSRAPSYDVDIQAVTSKGADPRVRVIARSKDGATPETIDLFFTHNPPYRLVEESAESGKITHKHYKQYDHYLTNPDEGYPFLVNKLKKRTAHSEPGHPSPPAPDIADEADAAAVEPPAKEATSPEQKSVAAPQETGPSWWKLMLGGGVLVGLGFGLGRLGRRPQP